MNKIQIRALGLLLIALPYAGNAFGNSAHGDSQLRTFTTAEIQNAKTIIPDELDKKFSICTNNRKPICCNLRFLM